jgi:hypothetical protein
MNQEYLLKEALIKLQGKIETFDKIKKSKGEDFNIFSILKMERLEVETHSSFIYELLNPNASHSQGTIYLELFFEEVLVDCKNFDFPNLSVKREHYIADEGRIDFTISDKETFIAIEMKIDAPDQPKQIQRYIDIAEKKAINSKVYYLTLDGKNASEISIKSSDANNVLYTKISFSNHIVKWLKKCIERSARLPIIRESLIQYLNLIYKLTGIKSREITMEVEELIDNPHIAHAATEMSKNLGYIWAKKEAYFWNSVIKKFEDRSKEIGWDWESSCEVFFDEDDEYQNDIEEIALSIDELRSNKDGDVGISFTKTINKKEITLRLYQYNSQDKLMYQLDEIEEYGKNQMTKLAQCLNIERKNGNARYGYSNLLINFYGKNVSEPTYELFESKILEDYIDKTLDDIVEKLKIIDDCF